MKHILLLLLLCSNYLHASPLAVDKQNKIQEIIELFQQKSNDTAIKQLKLHEDMLLEAIDASEDAHAYMLLGRAYFYAEQDSKAKNAFNAALRYNSMLPGAHFFIGLINKYSSNFDDAEKSFRNAIELDIDNDNYYFELGVLLEKKNDTKSALKEYLHALKINKLNSGANFNAANIYISMGDNENAEKRYLAAVKTDPDNISTNYNLGQLYQNTNQHLLAIKYFSKVVELDPLEWRALAKVIQGNHALGNFSERDVAINKIYSLWRSGAANKLLEQAFYIREQSVIDVGKLFVLEYFELKGERARKFVFKLQDPVTGDHKFDVSLGSYESTTQFSRHAGDIGPNERVYHLDGYAPNGNHYTFGFYNSEPDYDVVRNLALKALSGKLNAISSTIPSESGGVKVDN